MFKTNAITGQNFKVTVNAGLADIGDITCTKLFCGAPGECKPMMFVYNHFKRAAFVFGYCRSIAVCDGKLFCEVNAGRGETDKITCPDTEIKVAAGAAVLGFAGNRQEYDAVVDVSAGSCTGLETQSGTGGKKIKVSVSANIPAFTCAVISAYSPSASMTEPALRRTVTL